MTRTGFYANEITNLKKTSFKERLGSAAIAEGVDMQNIHIHCMQCKHDNFCMDSLIAHMHRTLIKAIGCLTGVCKPLQTPYLLTYINVGCNRLYNTRACYPDETRC